MKRTLLLILFLCCLFCLSNTVFAQVDLYLDNINVYVSSFGRISLYTLPDTIEQIDRISVLVESGPNEVFDYYNDQDVEDSTTLIDPPTWGDYEIYGSYNNNYSGLPPNILFKQNVYCWKDGNYAIIKYTFINREDSTIDAILGLDLVPQVEDSFSGGDTVVYSSSDKIVSVKKTEAVGFKVLSEDIKNMSMFLYYGDYRNDSVYYELMTSGVRDSLFITDPNDPNVDDPVIIPSFNSRKIASGDSAVLYVAIAYGADKAEMKASIASAEEKYASITKVLDYKNINPSSFSLEQNYPNPFNPSTIISFNLPSSEFVTLKVFNALGQEVEELVNKELAAGIYSYRFEAGHLASGIYFYQINAGNISQTKKMLLLK